MIVSHAHKFIYVSASKVASKSVHDFLARHCEDGDVVDESSEGYHTTPMKIKEFVGERTWSDYRKIVNVRNPWDVLVSSYFFSHNSIVSRTGQVVPALFEDFLWWHFSGIGARTAGGGLNKDMWFVGGQWWADHYLRFESIECDCCRLFQEFGFEFDGLKKENSQFRIPGIHYSLLYSPWSLRKVAEIYAPEIEKFGYEFEHVLGPHIHWTR